MVSRNRSRTTPRKQADSARPPRDDGGERSARFGWVELALLATLALLLAHAAMYWFLTDDAFISFRYARNLSHGLGLVFNPGHERVEGYTNFLWVLLLAGFSAIGLTPERVANVLSMGATIVLWGLIVWFVRRSPPAPPRAWLLLVAPLFLAATRSVAVWSTGGLETRLFEVLTVAGTLRLVVEVEALLAGRPRRGAAGYFFALATLTRPDGLLISLCALAAVTGVLVARRCRPSRSFTMQFVAYALIVGAHSAFRLAYYGQWLPNTYFAKVDGRTWWDMGFVYFAMFVLEYTACLWIPLLIGAVLGHRKQATLFTPALFAAIILPHALYIAAIGGDHFEYRPVDLYFPLLFILLYDGARYWARGPAASVVTAGYLVLTLVGLVWLPLQSHIQSPTSYAAAFPGRATEWVASSEFLQPDRDPLYRWPLLRPLAVKYRDLLRDATLRFIGTRQEEHRLFLESMRPGALRLRQLVAEGLLPADFHVALNCVGVMPYYSDLRVLDRLGLTDATVAHSGFAEGLRIMAHGKRATPEYMQRAGVEFVAWDGAHSVLPVSDPQWAYVISQALQEQMALYVADVGNGDYLCGYLPQGSRRIQSRAPRLAFRPLTDSTVAATIVQQAIEAQERKLKEKPGDAAARLAMANLFAMSPAHHAKAVEQYRALLAEQPGDANVWDKLAYACVQVGEIRAAEEALERAVALGLERGGPPPPELAEFEKHLAALRAHAPPTSSASQPTP